MMQRRFGTSVIGLIGLVGLAALNATAAPAAAQGARQSTRKPSNQPSQPRVIPPGSSILVPLPPQQVWNPAEELLMRDFMQMRATAKDPDKFLYGRYNPRYQVVTPQPIYQPYPYPGYYYGTPVFSNPYLVNRFGYGYGYGPGLQQQREVIVIREGNGNQVQQPQQYQPAPAHSERQPEGAPRNESLKSDFYLGDKGRAEALPDALDDIRKAWLNGDFERLNARFKADSSVRIFPSGRFKYSVTNAEFLRVVKDAMTRIDTVAFDLERPKSEESGRAFVGGKHTFLDGEKKRQEIYVSYTLQRADGKWLITEAGSSGSPITRHEE